MVTKQTTWADIFAMWPQEVRRSRIYTVADDLGVSYNRVYKWIRKNRVPAGYLGAILEAANKRKLSITPDQLVFISSYK